MRKKNNAGTIFHFPEHSTYTSPVGRCQRLRREGTSSPIAGGRLGKKEHSAYGYVFFFQAEDGIRDVAVTGVQTCALPISTGAPARAPRASSPQSWRLVSA